MALVSIRQVGKMEYPNWFNHTAKGNFEKFLTPMAGKPHLRFLQLGVYTGDASLWLAQNILTHKTSFVVDVDTWKGSDEDAHREMDFEDVYNTYLAKTADYEKSISVKRRSTIEHFINLSEFAYYHFIYIDADHTTVGVIVDAELSWRLLEVDGIMAFDDYTWGKELPQHLAPALGIDLFLKRHASEYETLEVGQQYWIRRIK
jgi:predicted O-methyltransferase YrrM